MHLFKFTARQDFNLKTHVKLHYCPYIILQGGAPRLWEIEGQALQESQLFPKTWACAYCVIPNINPRRLLKLPLQTNFCSKLNVRKISPGFKPFLNTAQRFLEKRRVKGRCERFKRAGGEKETCEERNYTTLSLLMNVSKDCFRVRTRTQTARMVPELSASRPWKRSTPSMLQGHSHELSVISLNI